jgi:pimeloyl-ACP methyl ester carboxylesterase
MTVGLVLLPGKYEDRFTERLAASLRKAGYEVRVPTVPWSSKNEIYRRSVDSSLVDIDPVAEELRARGKLVVAGFSLGGNIAVRYAATRDHVDGVVALVPAHHPDREINRRKFAHALCEARQRIREDTRTVVNEFPDWDWQKWLTDVPGTPDAFITWWGVEDGHLVMPRNIQFKRPIPLLFVSNRNDPTQRPREEVFDRAPPHPLSCFDDSLQVDHRVVPVKASGIVLEWLAKMASQ